MVKVIVLVLATMDGGLMELGTFKTNEECQAAYQAVRKNARYLSGACVWVWKPVVETAR